MTYPNSFLKDEKYLAKINEALEVGKKARGRGYDPTDTIESIFILHDFERICNIIGLKGVEKRLKELARDTKNPFKLAYQIAEDIILGRFAFLTDEAALFLATKAAVTILTRGIKYHYVTSIKGVKLEKNGDATSHISLLLSQNSVLPPKLLFFIIVLLDKLRRPLGIDRWKIDTLPKKVVLDILNDFYSHTKEKKLSLKDIMEFLKNLPIKVIEENKKEQVSPQLAKLLIKLPEYERWITKLFYLLNMEKWKWIENLQIKIERTSELILISPNTKGGFRLVPDPTLPKNLIGLHPAIYSLFEGKITYGTKVYVNNKGPYGVAFFENLTPPLVKLKNGTTCFFSENVDKKEVKEVLFLGDLLINDLSGEQIYTEKDWLLQLLQSSKEKYEEIVEKGISFALVKEISKNYGLPLHPKYLYSIYMLTIPEILTLRNSMKLIGNKDKFLLSFDKKVQALLEKSGVPFEIIGEEIHIKNEDAEAFYFLLRPDKELNDTTSFKSSNELLSYLSGVKIPTSSPSYVSLSFKINIEREKKKKEKPHVIFPLGDYYHINPDLLEHNTIYVELANLYCDNCSIFTLSRKCPVCNSKTKFIYFCDHCRKVTTKEICDVCGSKTRLNYLKGIKLSEELQRQSKIIGLKPLKPLIGVEEIHSSIKIPEPLSKGIIRQYHALTVGPDATIRSSAYISYAKVIKAAKLTHNLKKLKEIGYEKDLFGKELLKEDQLIELKPFDVMIPKEMAKLFVKVTKYLDELLIRLYKLEEFYQVDSPEDLTGHLVVVIPKGSNTGIIFRIVGFTNDNAIYIHPSVLRKFKIIPGFQKGNVALLLDVLLNFSKYYLNEEQDDFPFFLQPVGIKQTKSQITTYKTFINLKKGPTDKNSFKDLYEALQFQLQVLQKIRPFSSKDVLHSTIDHVIVKDLLSFIIKTTTGKFVCPSCGTLLRRIPLSKKCPNCKKEVKPLFSPLVFAQPLYTLRNLVDKIEDGNIKEKLALVIENIDMLTKIKKQSTITDFL